MAYYADVSVRKRRVMKRRTVDILQGHRSALALGLPRYVDIIAMVMRKVKQGSAMAGVKNSLKKIS
jgi:hypothetical protein